MLLQSLLVSSFSDLEILTFQERRKKLNINQILYVLLGSPIYPIISLLEFGISTDIHDAQQLKMYHEKESRVLSFCEELCHVGRATRPAGDSI